MKRLLVPVALALIAFPAFAAIQYEFVQKNTSDDSIKPVTDLTARATVDGTRSRVDFLAGNLYPPGTYVVSHDGAQLYFVDPAKRWYTEYNTAHAASALGATNIKIENLKSDVRKLDDGKSVAGIKTDHYRLNISYDITVTVKTIPLKQHVETEIDAFTTLQFGSALTNTWSQRGARTGNTAVDELIDTETGRIPGFPLRQTVTTRTFFNAPARRSELKVPTKRTIVREMWVTQVKETASDAALFTVPASYRPADQPEQKPAAQLTFEPGS